MNKRALAIAGVSLAGLASIAPAAVAQGTSSSKAAATHYTTIAATPNKTAPSRNMCGTGYPTNTPVLTLTPSSQRAQTGSNFKFSGTYTCNGKGLTYHHIELNLSYTAKPSRCKETSKTGGNYTCRAKAKASGTAYTTTNYAQSPTVTVTAD